MTDAINLRFFVRGGADTLDALVSRAAGGTKLDKGVAERIAEAFPHVTVDVTVENEGGIAGLRQALEDGSSPIVGGGFDVVILSIADEVAGLPERGEDAVAAVKADLVACVEAIKEQGTHVLVANASTVDPDDHVANYHGRTVEPVVLRIHRLDLMLIAVSHEEGVSVIDVDRLIAELGGAGHVAAATRYSETACGRIADETVRILEDYGFFDERPILAQVGAKAAGRS